MGRVKAGISTNAVDPSEAALRASVRRVGSEMARRASARRVASEMAPRRGRSAAGLHRIAASDRVADFAETSPLGSAQAVNAASKRAASGAAASRAPSRAAIAVAASRAASQADGPAASRAVVRVLAATGRRAPAGEPVQDAFG